MSGSGGGALPGGGGLELSRDWISGQSCGTDGYSWGIREESLILIWLGLGCPVERVGKYWVGRRKGVTGGAGVDAGVGIPSCPPSCPAMWEGALLTPWTLDPGAQ